MKNERNILGFSFSIDMVNFEAFHWVFLSQTNCLFLNCDIIIINTYLFGTTNLRKKIVNFK